MTRIISRMKKGFGVIARGTEGECHPELFVWNTKSMESIQKSQLLIMNYVK